MEDAGDNGIFVHSPLFKDSFDGERMHNVGLASFAELAFVSLGSHFNGLFYSVGIFFGHSTIIALCPNLSLVE